MTNDKLYQLMKERMREAAVVPPQTVGPLTPIYKWVVPQLKWQPWRTIALLSFLFAASLYVVFGYRVVKLASLLQFGF